MKKILTATCDMCYRICTGIQLYADGKKTVFTCKMCNPIGYDDECQRQKDRWFKSGKVGS